MNDSVSHPSHYTYGKIECIDFILDKDYFVKRGDKISQLKISPIIRPFLEVVDELEDTDRGSGGFGSSGR